MRISHILYKVKDKKKAVKQFEELGFTVTKGDFNYNIWFEDGSFIENFFDNLNGFILGVLKLIGKKSMANKFGFYKKADYGFMEYALETDATDLEKENNILKNSGYKFNTMQMKKKLESGKRIEIEGIDSDVFHNESISL